VLLCRLYKDLSVLLISFAITPKVYSLIINYFNFKYMYITTIISYHNHLTNIIRRSVRCAVQILNFSIPTNFGDSRRLGVSCGSWNGLFKSGYKISKIRTMNLIIRACHFNE